eukprot:TRINITY_DN2184_c1_g1_i9.p1 TRINITY_DN2184_c1_g1~~TRINITY_DN2184_c1_g1_i9.p1  ORF type:complete len:760 (-),score=109.73 TRINITY_DN2184_c1_g1_i9:122-2401(-)
MQKLGVEPVADVKLSLFSPSPRSTSVPNSASPPSANASAFSGVAPSQYQHSSPSAKPMYTPPELMMPLASPPVYAVAPVQTFVTGPSLASSTAASTVPATSVSVSPAVLSPRIVNSSPAELRTFRPQAQSAKSLTRRVTDVLRECQAELAESHLAVMDLESQRELLSATLQGAERDFWHVRRELQRLRGECAVARRAALSPAAAADRSQQRSSERTNGARAASVGPRQRSAWTTQQLSPRLSMPVAAGAESVVTAGDFAAPVDVVARLGAACRSCTRSEQEVAEANTFEHGSSEHAEPQFCHSGADWPRGPPSCASSCSERSGKIPEQNATLIESSDRATTCTDRAFNGCIDAASSEMDELQHEEGFPGAGVCNDVCSRSLFPANVDDQARFSPESLAPSLPRAEIQTFSRRVSFEDMPPEAMSAWAPPTRRWGSRIVSSHSTGVDAGGGSDGESESDVVCSSSNDVVCTRSRCGTVTHMVYTPEANDAARGVDFQASSSTAPCEAAAEHCQGLGTAGVGEDDGGPLVHRVSSTRDAAVSVEVRSVCWPNAACQSRGDDLEAQAEMHCRALEEQISVCQDSAPRASDEVSRYFAQAGSASKHVTFGDSSTHAIEARRMRQQASLSDGEALNEDGSDILDEANSSFAENSGQESSLVRDAMLLVQALDSEVGGPSASASAEIAALARTVATQLLEERRGGAGDGGALRASKSLPPQLAMANGGAAFGRRFTSSGAPVRREDIGPAETGNTPTELPSGWAR